MPLKEAKKFLQQSCFKFALMASLEVLERYTNNSEAILSGAADAYDAILRFRRAREQAPPTAKLAEVVELFPKRKAA